MTTNEHNRFPDGRWTHQTESARLLRNVKAMESLNRIEHTIAEFKFALDLVKARANAEDCVWLRSMAETCEEQAKKMCFRLERQREYERGISSEPTTPGPLGD